jgi:hypothetical protein
MMMRAGTYGYNPESLGDISAQPASRLVRATNDLFRKSDTGEIKAYLYTLESLVSELCPFESSRPHDIIYGVLGLASDFRPEKPLQLRGVDEILQRKRRLERNIKLIRMFASPKDANEFPVDYNKSPLAVFKLFVNSAIRRSNSLDIICRPWAPEQGWDDMKNEIFTIKLPSWMPKISNQPFERNHNGKMSRVNADALVGSPNSVPKVYNASQSEKLVYQLDAHGENSMTVAGFVLGRIDETFDASYAGDVPPSWLEAGHWTDPKNMPPETLWRTLVADRGPNGSNPQRWYPRAFHFAATDQGLRAGFKVDRLIHNSTCSIVSELFRRVQSVIFNRRLFFTSWKESGRKVQHLGLAPEQATKGDSICILFGCSVPVCLRRKTKPTRNTARERPYKKRRLDGTAVSPPTINSSPLESFDTPTRYSTPDVQLFATVPPVQSPPQPTDYVEEFELIGECYVHEAMDGKAIDTIMRENKIPTRKFALL